MIYSGDVYVELAEEVAFFDAANRLQLAGFENHSKNILKEPTNSKDSIPSTSQFKDIHRIQTDEARMRSISKRSPKETFSQLKEINQLQIDDARIHPISKRSPKESINENCIYEIEGETTSNIKKKPKLKNSPIDNVFDKGPILVDWTHYTEEAYCVEISSDSS